MTDGDCASRHVDVDVLQPEDMAMRFVEFGLADPVFTAST